MDEEKKNIIHLCICDPNDLNFISKLPKELGELPYFSPLTAKVGSSISLQIKENVYVMALVVDDRNYKNNFNWVRTLLKKIKGQASIFFYHQSISDQVLRECLAGIYLTEYNFGSQKSTNEKVSIALEESKIDQKIVTSSKNLAKSLLTTMTIIDLPANVKTPDYLAAWLEDFAKDKKFEITILNTEMLKDQGFGAIVGVGQGSIFGSYLAVMKYKGNADKKGYDLAIIGKGVTFDTGGISLKDSSNMHYMKSDLGGAAAVIGAMELIESEHKNANVLAVIPIVENAIDANSIRPGDVLKAYNGKTIEVIDTDAEGRLILADAISYVVKNYETDTIIDLATLTGNCVQALGYKYAGLFSKNEDLVRKLSQLGEQTGDHVWSLPMHDDYADMMKTDIADIKNYHGKPFAGAITAAKFLEFFTDDHLSFAHLDIAGVAFGDSDLTSSKIATGFGVRLLEAYIETCFDKK
jgi:leucyl aminopeptidase